MHSVTWKSIQHMEDPLHKQGMNYDANELRFGDKSSLHFKVTLWNIINFVIGCH